MLLFVREVLLLSPLLLCSALITTLHPRPALDSLLSSSESWGNPVQPPHHTHTHTRTHPAEHTHSHTNSGTFRVSGAPTHTVTHSRMYGHTYICTHSRTNTLAHTVGFRPGGFGSDCRLGLWRDLYGACRAHLWLLLSDGRQLAVCAWVCVLVHALCPGQGRNQGRRREACVCLGHRASPEWGLNSGWNWPKLSRVAQPNLLFLCSPHPSALQLEELSPWAPPWISGDAECNSLGLLSLSAIPWMTFNHNRIHPGSP